MDHRLDLEMAISREEFLRLLPGAVGSFAEGEEGLFRGADGAGGWTIRLVSLEELRLGSVVLPRHRVEVRLADCPAEAAQAFMARLLRGFMRGGG
ncbi:hypothetical protein [Geothrix alkalitolerans]|uniref:hypothetical protein n=1 Tax=Geothrix alkalitolerans TaxID=2922724 RepID=UPI001FAE8364|nr:hypothetical protein [Geothrix alkalitolerans]